MTVIRVPRRWSYKPPIGQARPRPGHFLCNDLRGYWLFNEGEGPTVLDLSPCGNHGTTVNAPAWETAGWTGCAGGHALRLVGASSQYVDCGDDPSVNPSGEITIAVQYRLASLPGAVQYQLAAKDNNTGGRAWALDIDANSNLGVRFYIGGGGNPGFNEFYEARAPQVGDDRLAMASYRSDGRFRLWIDGIRVAGASGDNSGIPASTTNLCLGRRAYPGFEGYFDGSIRLAALWGRAFDDDEAASFAEYPFAPVAPPASRAYVVLGAAGGGGGGGGPRATVGGLPQGLGVRACVA